MERYISNDWATKKEIIARINQDGNAIHERSWRKYVEHHNKQYCSHEVDTYIVHSCKGYKLSTNKDEINASILEGKKRALNLLWKYSQTRKALGEVDNIKIDLEKMGIL